MDTKIKWSVRINETNRSTSCGEVTKFWDYWTDREDIWKLSHVDYCLNYFTIGNYNREMSVNGTCFQNNKFRTDFPDACGDSSDCFCNDFCDMTGDLGYKTKVDKANYVLAFIEPLLVIIYAILTRNSEVDENPILVNLPFNFYKNIKKFQAKLSSKLPIKWFKNFWNASYWLEIISIFAISIISWFEEVVYHPFRKNSYKNDHIIV